MARNLPAGTHTFQDADRREPPRGLAAFRLESFLHPPGRTGEEGPSARRTFATLVVMTEAEVEAVFIAAGKSLSMVCLTEPSGRYRVAEPYMIFRSSTGKRLFHMFQVGGYSASGVVRGWKNAEVSVFEEAQVLSDRFTPRADYNPSNLEMFPQVIWSLLPASGRKPRPPHIEIRDRFR